MLTFTPQMPLTNSRLWENLQYKQINFKKIKEMKGELKRDLKDASINCNVKTSLEIYTVYYSISLSLSFLAYTVVLVTELL